MMTREEGYELGADPAVPLDRFEGNRSAMVRARMLRGEAMTTRYSLDLGASPGVLSLVISELRTLGFKVHERKLSLPGAKAPASEWQVTNLSHKPSAAAFADVRAKQTAASRVSAAKGRARRNGEPEPASEPATVPALLGGAVERRDKRKRVPLPALPPLLDTLTVVGMYVDVDNGVHVALRDGVVEWNVTVESQRVVTRSA